MADKEIEPSPANAPTMDASAIDALLEAGDASSFGRFVDLLLDSADNPFLASIIPLYALSRRFWLAHYARQVRFEPGAITDFHIRIGEAVAAGEEAEAGRLADAFLDHVEAFARFVGLDLAASS